jgi:poly-gamma-glutamate synthesis protein (capsule biosynthesis protein)
MKASRSIRLTALALLLLSLTAAFVVYRISAHPAPPTVTYPRELGRVSFAVAGDVIPHEAVRASAVAAGPGAQGWTALFANVADIFERADYGFVNLETPVAPNHSHGTKPFLFDAPTDLLDAIKASGIKIVSFANNHVMDQGWAGFTETREHLRERQILFAGSGDTAATAWQPVILEKNGIKVGLLGMTRWLNGAHNPEDPNQPHVNFLPYPSEMTRAEKLKQEEAKAQEAAAEKPATGKATPEKAVPEKNSEEKSATEKKAEAKPAVVKTPNTDPASLDEDALIEAVKKARAQCDFLVVSIHWGIEYAPAPRPDDVELAHRILDAGASVVVGHHPHVLQPVESYRTPDGRNTLILYSLGNFLSNQSRSYVDDLMPDKQGDPRDELIAMFSVVKKDYGPAGTKIELADVGIIPIWEENNRNEIAAGKTKTPVIHPIVIDREMARIQARLDELTKLTAPSAPAQGRELTVEEKKEFIELSDKLKLLDDRRRILLNRTGDEFVADPPALAKP